METDLLLCVFYEERDALLERVAHLDQMIQLRKAHLARHPASRSRCDLQLSHGNDNPIKQPMSKTTDSEARRGSGIMRATQETALEMLRAGRPYVQTGEVIRATIAKGYTYTSPKPTKKASSYLKFCHDLENFVVD